MAKSRGVMRALQRAQLAPAPRPLCAGRRSLTQAATDAEAFDPAQLAELQDLERDSSLMTPPGKKGNRSKIINRGQRYVAAPAGDCGALALMLAGD